MCRWKAAIVSAVSALALACTSPTLPLPPPELPSESTGTEPNSYVLSGVGGIPGAFLIVYDSNAPAGENALNGSVVGNDGKWSVTIFANKGDAVLIWQNSGGRDSPSIDFTIQ